MNLKTAKENQSMTETKFFAKGEIIFKENSWELAMYDIKKGKVGIYVNYGKEDQKMLTELDAGKYFGEMGVIDAMPRTATAAALEDTEVTVIDSNDFEAYLSQDPEKIIDVFQKLCGRLRELSESYVEACATVTEYVESKENDKPKGLMAKIRKLLTVNSDYAEAMPKAYHDAFFAEEMNNVWYF